MAGVELLLNDERFATFAGERPFRLVIGLDGITDPTALEALGDAQRRFNGLEVQAFLHDRTNVLFHPKLCWLQIGGSVMTLVGSGNLTRGGLRENWEAYFEARLERTAARELLAAVDAWLAQAAPHLRPIDDPRVLERATRNLREKRLFRRRFRRGEDVLPEVVVADTAAELAQGTPVLIAEIPKGASPGRWQANFHLEDYLTFFGVTLGEHMTLDFQAVTREAGVQDVEHRPGGRPTRSRNFRFELAGRRGVIYPEGDTRPIGAFLRGADGRILYQLIMPGEPGHMELAAFLPEHGNGASTNMRSVRTDAATLGAAWPAAPILAAARNLGLL